MRRILIIIALVLLVVSAAAQTPDVDAFREAIFATRTEDVLRHLPPEAAKEFAKLSRPQQKELEKILILSDWTREMNVLLEPEPEVGLFAKLTNQKPGESPEIITVALEGRESANDESTLLFKASFPDDTEKFEIKMRYLDNEWRIYTARAVSDSSLRLNLEDPEIIAKIAHVRIEINESFARSALWQLATAVIRYEAEQEEGTAPVILEDLRRLLESSNDDSLGKLVPAHINSPYTYRGYRFRYTRTGMSEFTITARPLKFGVQGDNSFFIDETLIVTSCPKDKEPTRTCDEE